MNKPSIALACTLMVAGCAGATNRPAENSTSSTTYYVTPSDSSAIDATAAPPPGIAMLNSRVGSPSMPDTRAADARPSSTNPAPVSTTGVTAQTADSKLSNRDRNAAFIPMNQGNSASETDITASVRRGIMSDKNLSFGAQNAQVMTLGNKVTLRGPVRNEQERTLVAAIARRTSGVYRVDNQLEVEK